MTDPMLQWPVLRQGYDGHPCRTVRLLLRAQSTEIEELAGFADLPPDGSYNSTVASGVAALQRAKGLERDGVLGRRTWPVLCPAVRRGDRGQAVEAVQWENQYRNMADPAEARGLVTDGIFGPATERWVRGFQGAIPLEVDGVVGPLTWTALVMGWLAG